MLHTKVDIILQIAVICMVFSILSDKSPTSSMNKDYTRLIKFGSSVKFYNVLWDAKFESTFHGQD